jgi:polyphosphate kinase
MALAAIPRPDLRDRPIKPAKIWRRGSPDIFEEIRYRDQLVHHPFDSFQSVESFVDAAIDDPRVIAIKMTLYRIGANSPVVDRLIRAAERGKQVAVLVELKARFDEENNIEWARRLEQAGVHVVYGMVGLKTHSKLALIVRREGDALRRYVHIATGNYNPTTSRLYTDIGLLTTDSVIGDDATDLFNFLTGFSIQKDFSRLMVAPLNLRKRMMALIKRETEHARAGRPAHIMAKVNRLTDLHIIEALYEASQAGVKIDLIVRGVCALRPGMPEVSENIRVRSVVGRFLEHTRVFYFHNDGADDVFLASADWMPRNFFRRVEVCFPVRDPKLKKRVIAEGLLVYLEDNSEAWEMDADGAYRCRMPGEAPRLSAQQALLERLAGASAS